MPPLFPSFENEDAQSPSLPLAAESITSERLKILEHPPQGQVRVKTGAPTRIGAAVCHLNG